LIVSRVSREGVLDDLLLDGLDLALDAVEHVDVLVDDVNHAVGGEVRTAVEHAIVPFGYPAPHAIDHVGRAGRDGDEPVLAEEEADESGHHFLVERGLPAPERDRLHEDDGLGGELLGLRPDLVADVLDGQPVEVEGLGDRR